jgi:cytoskeletal protein RodZ
VSVGQLLASARTERGLTVDDVSAATRIRATLIRDIERDDFHACGGDVYARGHIRSIARVVGADPAQAIAAYDAAGNHGEEPPVAAAPVAPQTDRAALAHSERRGPNWTAAMVVALLVIIAVAAYGLVHSGGHGRPSRTAGRQPVTTSSTPPASPSTSTSPAKPPPSSVAELPSKAILLVRATSGTTWLQVTDASTGAVLYEGDLAAGQQKRFIRSNPLSFVIGNAPAVDIVINGKDVGQPPSSGSVARGRVKPGSDRIQQA